MITFSKGERLTAEKMNALSKQFDNSETSIPNFGFKGSTLWTSSREMQNPHNEQAPQTFSFSYLFNSNDVIEGFKIQNCKFFEGGEFHELSDQIIRPDAPKSVTSLNLIELSAKNQSPSPRYRVLDNIAIEMEYPQDDISVVNEWPLYQLDNAFVCCDIRTSFVQTAAGTGGGGSNVVLDLSSTNWGSLSSTDPESELTAVVQNWNYQSPLSDDLMEMNALSDALCCRFLARPEEGGTLKYVSLSGILSSLSSEISSHSGCSCDLTAELTSGTKIATWTKDGVNMVDIYAPTGGGGSECSCEMSAIAPQYDINWQGQQQQYWQNAKVGQFTDCKGDKTMLYAPNHIQLSCNMYPYYTNMGNQFTFTTGVSSNVQIVPDGTTVTFNIFYV